MPAMGIHKIMCTLHPMNLHQYTHASAKVYSYGILVKESENLSYILLDNQENVS